MNSMVVSVVVLLLAWGGLLLGLRVALLLPARHLHAEARSTAQIGIGMLATLSALVRGLMITSAKNSFDERRDEIVKVSTSIVLLDRALAGYGDESKAARDELKGVLDRTLQRVWPDGNLSIDEFRTPLASFTALTHLQATILALTPTNATQHWFQARALSLTTDLGYQRVLTVERNEHSMPAALLVVLAVWLALLFFGLGVFAVRNRTFVVALATRAMAFAGSTLLILELDTPCTGVIGISSEPLRNASSALGH
jgi:hypothetical protein